MLTEVRLVIAAKEARLVLKHDEQAVEDEIWKISGSFSRKDAMELCRVVFDDAYDILNAAAHGEQ